MAAALGRAWGWLRPCGGGSSPGRDRPPAPRAWSSWGSWLWPARSTSSGEQYWEAQEKLPPAESAGPAEASAWGNLLPAALRWAKGPPRAAAREPDADGDLSDYGTPPPSPTPPPQLSSPFRLFTRSLRVEVLPEHHQICFNFLRHLFDLLVVGFLWTVSPPTKLVLEVLGVRGPLCLWLHGMAMFLVSTVGMAGLLWWVQEYLPQFALVYGLVQALVISVSMRGSLVLGEDPDEDEEPKDQPGL